MNINVTPNKSKSNDEISLKDLIIKILDWWRYLLSKWLIILIAGIIGGGLGLLYASSQKTVYTATLTFVLEEEGKGNLGNLGGLAAIAGFNVGGGVSDGLFQGDNIFELYKSRSMLTKTLLSHTNLNDSLLIERYLTFSDLREKWKGNPELDGISFSIPEDQFTLQHYSIIGNVIDLINSDLLNVSKPDKKTSLIHVETNSKNESFSKDFTETLVENVNSLYINTKDKKNLVNLTILQHQTDSVRQELNSAIGGVATSLDANPNANPARQALRINSSRKQVDVQANQAILMELVKNLEMAKISLRKETPLIQIIDLPVLPLKKKSFGKVKGMIIGGILSGFLICVFFLGKRFFGNVMNND